MKNFYQCLAFVLLFLGLFVPAHAQDPIYLGKIEDVATTYKE
ncbi:hypothetical protein BH24BAC1_BH24BAC1_35470 [soil metagenome]